LASWHTRRDVGSFFGLRTARLWLKTWPNEGGLFLMPDSFATDTGYEAINRKPTRNVGARTA
jgi:hypothetical protein